MNEGELEKQSPPTWTEADNEDLAYIQNMRGADVHHALVLKKNELITGWMIYMIDVPDPGETDPVLSKRRMYIEWWEIPKDMRSPGAVRSFLKSLYTLLIQKDIESVHCDVTDTSPIKPYLVQMFSKRSSGPPDGEGGRVFFDFSTKDIGEQLKM